MLCKHLSFESEIIFVSTGPVSDEETQQGLETHKKKHYSIPNKYIELWIFFINSNDSELQSPFFAQKTVSEYYYKHSHLLSKMI